MSGAGSADGVTFCIQNDPRGATALGGGSGGSEIRPDWWPRRLTRLERRGLLYGPLAYAISRARGRRPEAP